MTPYRASPEDGLGETLAEFRRDRRTVLSDVLLGAVMIVFGVGLTFRRVGEPSAAASVFGLAILAGGIAIAGHAFADLGLTMRICSLGLVYRRRGKTVTVRYDRVRHILTAPLVSNNWTLGLHWWVDRHTLVLDDGTRVELSCPFLDNERVQSLLDERLAHLTQEAEHTLGQGDSVRFGPFGRLVVHPDRVETRDGTFTFAELASIERAYGRDDDQTHADVVMKATDGRTVSIPIDDLSDVHALVAVVRARLTQGALPRAAR